MLSFLMMTLLSVVDNMNTSTINLSNDLRKTRNWEIQWKINFNPDPCNQAHEVILSRKLRKTNHNLVYFDHNSVQ